MAPAFRFSNVSLVQQYEELRRAYPALHAAIERAFQPGHPPQPGLFAREPSLSKDLREAKARWPRLLAEIEARSRGGEAGVSGPMQFAVAEAPLATVPVNPGVQKIVTKVQLMSAPGGGPAFFPDTRCAIRFRRAFYLAAEVGDPPERSTFVRSETPDPNFQFLVDPAFVTNGKLPSFAQPVRVAILRWLDADRALVYLRDGNGPDMQWWLSWEPPSRIEIGYGAKGPDKQLDHDHDIVLPRPPDEDQFGVRGRWISLMARTGGPEKCPAASMPPIGDFVPGEQVFDAHVGAWDAPPEVWSRVAQTGSDDSSDSQTEGDDSSDSQGGSNDSSDSPKYRSVIRSPYVQNVQPNRLTIVWRVTMPAAQAAPYLKKPAPAADALLPVAQLAPLGVPFLPVNAPGQVTSQKGQNLVAVAGKFTVRKLSGSPERPNLEFTVQFGPLEPGAAYHYRIHSPCYVDAQVWGANPGKPGLHLVADDVHLRMPPPGGATEAPIAFLAMGDMGRPTMAPQCIYSVGSLLESAARDAGALFWLPLGDIDNWADGSPPAMDPFFFNVYNAYGVPKQGWASPLDANGSSWFEGAGHTRTRVMAGMATYPVFGNHDDRASAASTLFKFYYQNFVLPTDSYTSFSQAFSVKPIDGYDPTTPPCAGFAFKQGNAVFIALPIAETWGDWHDKAMAALKKFLPAQAASNPRPWLIVYFHRSEWAWKLWTSSEAGGKFMKFLGENGVDLVLCGHEHKFRHDSWRWKDAQGKMRSIRVVMVGTGGASDPDDRSLRSGPALFRIKGDVLEYWKLDVAPCDTDGWPEVENGELKQYDPQVQEYCRITRGTPENKVEEYVLARPYKWPLPEVMPFKRPPRCEGKWTSATSEVPGFVYLGHDDVLRYDAATWQARLFKFNRARTWGDPMTQVSVNADRTFNDVVGKLQPPSGPRQELRLLYLGGELLLAYMPSGLYWVLPWGGGRLKTAILANLDAPKPVNKGTWTQFGQDHRLVYLGGDWLLDLVVGNSPSYRLWKFRRPNSPALPPTVTDPFVDAEPKAWFEKSGASPFSPGVTPDAVFGVMADGESWLLGIESRTGVCEKVPFEAPLVSGVPPFRAGTPVRMSAFDSKCRCQFLGPSEKDDLGNPKADTAPVVLVQDPIPGAGKSRLWEVPGFFTPK